jgi:hypothetical protein
MIQEYPLNIISSILPEFTIIPVSSTDQVVLTF